MQVGRRLHAGETARRKRRLSAPKAASSSVSGYSRMARGASAGSSVGTCQPSFGVRLCLLESASIRPASTARRSAPTTSSLASLASQHGRRAAPIPSGSHDRRRMPVGLAPCRHGPERAGRLVRDGNRRDIDTAPGDQSLKPRAGFDPAAEARADHRPRAMDRGASSQHRRSIVDRWRQGLTACVAFRTSSRHGPVVGSQPHGREPALTAALCGAGGAG